MPLILSLETSSDVCSVALHQNGKIVREIVVRETQAHAEKLAPAIHELLSVTSRSFKELNAIAISAGPGSYTGLRIGASTAKGICFAMDLPLISIPTLELMAFTAVGSVTPGALLCPMIDARRMEVYCQVFDSTLNTILPATAKVIDESSFNELLDVQKVFFFGNGADKCREVLRHPNAVFLDNIVPLASLMGEVAHTRFQKKEFEDMEKFKPFYLKDFVAKKSQPLLG
jgi:tRNA threonylcarbamoyladenosine biosynthesis protein TsaB